jgi:soluble lytic murein transglycosylase
MAIADLSKSIFILLSVLGVQNALANQTISEEEREVRLIHAHELLGKYYKGSAAREGEKVKKINSAIYHWTRERLPKKYRKDYRAIAQTIIDESLKNEFDPVFLLSVIDGESSFNPNQVGGVGEIGLMQIRPETGKWIAEISKQKWKGDKSLFDPRTNIRLGAAYLSFLRDKFDNHAQLYLAAYNMGARKVASIQEQNIWPKDYPLHVMKRYVEFYSLLKAKRTAAVRLAVRE